jgi:DNA repair exonuclease SbcCD ATPase subunit
MNNRELFKEFMKKEIGYKMFEYMRLMYIHRDAFQRITNCSSAEIDEILKEIQDEEQQLLSECMEIDKPLIEYADKVINNLGVRWRGLSVLSEASARVYLSSIMANDSLYRPLYPDDDDDLPF